MPLSRSNRNCSPCWPDLDRSIQTIQFWPNSDGSIQYFVWRTFRVVIFLVHFCIMHDFLKGDNYVNIFINITLHNFNFS